MVNKEIPDPKVQQARRELLVHKELHQLFLDHRELMEQQALKELQVHKEFRDYKDLLDHRVNKEYRV